MQNAHVKGSERSMSHPNLNPGWQHMHRRFSRHLQELPEDHNLSAMCTFLTLSKKPYFLFKIVYISYKKE